LEGGNLAGSVINLELFNGYEVEFEFECALYSLSTPCHLISFDGYLDLLASPLIHFLYKSSSTMRNK
jgi:hypothetical protein